MENPQKIVYEDASKPSITEYHGACIATAFAADEASLE